MASPAIFNRPTGEPVKFMFALTFKAPLTRSLPSQIGTSREMRRSIVHIEALLYDATNEFSETALPCTASVPSGQQQSMRPESEGSNRLQGKKTLITGGDSGIGRAVALALHARAPTW